MATVAALAGSAIASGTGAAAGGVAGVAPSDAGTPAQQRDEVTLIDDMGSMVRVTVPARRIVSLAPSCTETLFLIGAGATLVGATRFDDYPPEALELPRVGGFADVDLERVLALQPDLVLAAGFHAGAVVQRLRSLGLSVLVVEPQDAMQTMDRIEMLGGIVGHSGEARRVAAELRARIAAIEERVAGAEGRPRVLYQLSRDLYSAGAGSFPHDLIVRAGGDNIAAAAGGRYPRLADEFVIASDPEVIFVAGHETGVTAEELAARPGWAGISAVRSGRIIVLEDPDVAGRPGPRIVEALEILARAIHPEVFRERPAARR